LPAKFNYQISPVKSAGKTVPRVLLVLSKDHKLFQQAYNELADMDGDGKVDTGFNPSVLYYGYFDSMSCYEYVGTPANSPLAGHYFRRHGPTKDDQTQQELDSSRPETVKGAGIPAARATHFSTGSRIGVCNNPHSKEGGYWSGNWLNYVTATRMDVIRKILYGGHRKVDIDMAPTTPARTVLSGSTVPRDAHSWGTDVLSDDRWASETAMTKYYDISKFTPFPKPSFGTAHFFARTRNNSDLAPFPVMEYILDAEQSHFTSNISVTGAAGRYYDWVLNDSPNPSSYNLVNPAQVIKGVTLDVEVCVKGNIGDGEVCRIYPNGNLKPVGLLQQYGEDGRMLFGLLTGSYDSIASASYDRADTRVKGGVVRSPINDLSSSIHLDSGIFLDGGLIKSIDALTIAGIPTPPQKEYSSAMSWGNPVGEMLYEAVRFFGRYAEEGETGVKSSPTAAFVPQGGESASGQGAFLSDWTDLPVLPAGERAKPVIILIAEAYSDFDGDTAVNNTGGIDRPLLAELPSSLSSSLPRRFDMETYLDRITLTEGLSTSMSGQTYFYSDGPFGNCLPKPLESLTQVNGLCPFQPSSEGTYSSAAVAYYAHTHSFATPGADEKSLDVYAITMSGVFPPLEFPVHEFDGSIAKRISVIPGSMSSRDPATTVDRIQGLLNYFIIDWQTDSRGTPYHVVVRVNFEDAFQSYDARYGGSDWDSDVLVEYTFDLVSDSKTDKSDQTIVWTPATDVMMSGALKLKGGSYYPFKTPYNVSFVIEPSDVVGMFVGTWKYMATANLDMMAGYTISGSTRDGTYMDIGHNNGQPRYATPPTCNWPAGYGRATEDNGTDCLVAFGSSPPLSYGDPISEKRWRTFEFNSAPYAAGTYLPGPLYLAAKYGGYDDTNRNGIPDPGEWEGQDGMTPRNYFEAINISELPGHLKSVFNDIGSGNRLNVFIRSNSTQDEN
jgi:type IV pilus assembly protein PilY1